MSTEQVLGAVVLDGQRHAFEGGAAEVLSAMRKRLGDRKTAEIVMDEGWSNGYLYLAPASVSAPS